MEVHVVAFADEQRVASPYHALGAYRLGEAAEGRYYLLLLSGTPGSMYGP